MSAARASALRTSDRSAGGLTRWIRIGIVGSFLLTAVVAAPAGGSAGREAAAPGAEEAASTAPASPPDLSASAEIRRSFMEPGQVAIAVTNHGEAAVRARRRRCGESGSRCDA